MVPRLRAAFAAIASVFLFVAASPARSQEPFTGSCTPTGGPSPLTPVCTIAVPAGKRLLVQRVSAQMSFPTGGKFDQLAIDYVTRGVSGRQIYNPVDSGVFTIPGSPLATIGSVSSEAYIAADAGSSLTIWFFAEFESNPPSSAQVWVTGTLSHEHDSD